MQSFQVTLLLETECRETLIEKQIKEWAEQQLEGCDIGRVKVTKVEEQ